ncbi:MAG: 1-deoxy-D-xylulose-5-phosphate reductoisomerase [Anaplasma sp.]
MKKVSIFGSTGCIGQKAVQILRDNSHDFEVAALVAGTNVHLLAFQAKLLNAKMAVISDDALYAELQELLSGTNIVAEAGREGVLAAASMDVDSAVMAIVGIAALEPVMRLIESGVGSIVLANKESVVCGGNLLIDAAHRKGVNIIPVDSEHNAIFQILSCNACVDKVILTASGGPFLHWTREQMKNVTPSDALKHPVWRMGNKISVDSSTMVNKSLEVIEAHYLFSLEPNKIDVLVHPESVVHAFASYSSGVLIALMSMPDMSIPVLHALYWPGRAGEMYGRKLDLADYGQLTFTKPDFATFPALNLGFEVLNSSTCHAAGIVLNAANDVAVAAFLNSKIAFLDIADVIRSVMDKSVYGLVTSVHEVMEYDLEGRSRAEEIIDALRIAPGVMALGMVVCTFCEKMLCFCV